MKLSHFAMGGLFLLLTAAIYLTMQSDMDGRMEEMKADYERRLDAIENPARKTPAAIVPAVAGAASDVTKGRPTKSSEAPKSVAPNVSRKESPSVADASVSEALENVKSKVKAQAQRNESSTDPGTEVGDPATAATNSVGELPPELLEREENILNSSGVGVERIARDTAEAIGAASPEDKLTNVQSLVVAQPRIARIKNSEEANKSGFVVLDRGLDANLAKGDSFAVRRGTAIIGRVVVGDTILQNECVADVVVDKLVTGMSLKKGDEIIKYDR